VTRPYPPLLSVPLPRRPVHRSPPHEAQRTSAKMQAAEDAVVELLAAQLGVRASDPAGQRVERTFTAADVRHAVRAAYRRGRDSRA
jgi:histone H3/H4